MDALRFTSSLVLTRLEVGFSNLNRALVSLVDTLRLRQEIHSFRAC